VVDDRRPGRSGTNGRHPEGLRTRPTALDPDGSEPVDLVAVQADDALINALSAGMTVSAPGVGGYTADDHVAAILAAWKAEVDAVPEPELVDLDTAVRTVKAARRPGRRFRHLAPVAAAAALVVVTGAGVSVGSATAQPDDGPLWAVSKVLFSERAESVEARVRVEENLARAKQALLVGDVEEASSALAAARVELAAVRPEENGPELAEVQSFLAAKAEETPDGTPTDPGAPLARDRSRKVPPGAVVPLPSATSPVTVPTTSAPVQSSAPASSPPSSSSAPTSDPVPSTDEDDEDAPPSATPEPQPDGGAGGGAPGIPAS
jgi:hypothetical protein